MITTQFEKALILSSGQVLGLAATVLVPMFLSRWLDVGNFGEFKLSLLIFGLAIQCLNLGMNPGLFYFAKKDPDRIYLYSANAFIVTVVSSIIICVALATV